MMPGTTVAVAGNQNRNCYQYDVQNNKWDIYLVLKFGHLSAYGTVYQNKVYIFDDASSEALDLKTKTGIEPIIPPNPVGAGACTVQFEDSVLVIGGKLSRFELVKGISFYAYRVFFKQWLIP
jgi:hypothetical protein